MDMTPDQLHHLSFLWRDSGIIAGDNDIVHDAVHLLREWEAGPMSPLPPMPTIEQVAQVLDLWGFALTPLFPSRPQFVIVQYHSPVRGVYNDIDQPSAAAVIGPYTLSEARAVIRRGDVQGPERVETFIVPITAPEDIECYLAFSAQGVLEPFDGSEDSPQTLDEVDR